ncbi:DUF4145 domain-containing protein [Corallococcus sp. bb12-1]|uniref:DUF4145 domain-containing protein n=1 Tax=Corallococcus sp. bb12-1 TaxID=2996784 RepID=UPI00226FCAEF|nr:DUF4145 domain-containing protein [Corallococcus sp. bb12-1]MCY1047648.1 DUF4145 domain-containing protein [Corallococcus sp. bb12-1]
MNSEIWEPDWYQGRFSCHLICNQYICRESVIVGGNVTRELRRDESGDEYYPHVYDPYFFYPATPLFRWPRSLPESIQQELIYCSSLIWNDPSSCANRIRTCVELLLTHLKIPRSQRSKKGDLVPLRLHRRIELFMFKQPELGESLMAIKWLGNIGSHEGGLTKTALLDGIELLEHVIIEIFEQRTKRLTKLRKEMVKRKGRPKHT